MTRRLGKRSESRVVKSRNENTVKFETEKIMLSSNSVSVKKVVLNFPIQLLERTDNVAELLHTDRSKLIREAVEEKVRQVEREQLERELDLAYTAHAKDAFKLYKEFEEGTLEILARSDA